MLDLPEANPNRQPQSVEATLGQIHQQLREGLPGVNLISFTLYDEETDHLKTFVHSTLRGNPLPHYAAKLRDVPSLKVLAMERRPRVISDFSLNPASTSTHTVKIQGAGYLSSYTTPIFESDRLLGFLFFDAADRDYFGPSTVHKLAIFTQLITMLMINALYPVKVLKSAVGLASALSRLRDAETGDHLERMSRYARLIASRLAVERGLSDEFVEFVFLFAPLHDLGKIGIPDAILLKPGPLSEEEFQIMRSHPVTGTQIIDNMSRSLESGDSTHISWLRNIVLYHHESFDGSGYVKGLKGEAIPLEARIITVADVYDALTSNRPYKEAWDSDRAFDFLRDHSGIKFDPDCVRILQACRADIEAIGRQFRSAKDDFGFHEAYFDPSQKLVL